MGWAALELTRPRHGWFWWISSLGVGREDVEGWAVIMVVRTVWLVIVVGWLGETTMTVKGEWWWACLIYSSVPTT